MRSLASWYEAEKDGAVAARLAKLRGAEGGVSAAGWVWVKAEPDRRFWSIPLSVPFGVLIFDRPPVFVNSVGLLT